MKELLREKRAQMAMSGGGKKIVGATVALAIMGILAAFLLPVAMNVFYGDVGTSSYNATTGDVTDLNAELNATVDSISAGTSATITLETDAKSVQKTVNVGENATYSFDRGDVTVGVEKSGTDGSANDYAVYNASYPRDFAYSSGASSLWTIIPVVIVLALLLYAVAKAREGY
jgi:hypothetical protein